MDSAKEQSMKFSSKVIDKTSKSQFKMNIYLLKYIVAKQIVYRMKELSACKNVHIRAQHVCFKRALLSIIQVHTAPV